MADITVEEIQAKLGDREWRLNNLYFIKDEKGDKVLFRLNEVQKELYDNLWFFNIVPKARQLGVTTFFTILYFDQVLFSKNKTAGIILHRAEDMKKVFRSKIRFCWDNLHPWLKAYIGEPNTDSAYEMVFPNGSSIFCSMTTRSGTVQFLHISEFGYICQHNPEKAEEIVTGAINSVHAGQMVSIESTAAGQEGYFYDFCMTASRMAQEGRQLTELDFKLFFFPWWVDERYVLEGDVTFTKEDTDYFEALKAKHGIDLTEPQKKWYVKKRQINGEKMFAEYPSTLDEAFMVSVEGSYFAKEMNKVYLTNRITPIPHDDRLEVDTWWDLGMDDTNVILFTQDKGPQIRFIDCYANSGEGLSHYTNVLKERADTLGYRYRAHHLPHDVEVRELGTGVSRKQALWDLGLRNVQVMPKIDIQTGIDRVRALFSKFYFDEVKTKKLYEALFNYRKDFDKKLGVFRNTPRHDSNSHWADPVRGLASVWTENIPLAAEEERSQEQSFFSH